MSKFYEYTPLDKSRLGIRIVEENIVCIEEVPLGLAVGILTPSFGVSKTGEIVLVKESLNRITCPKHFTKIEYFRGIEGFDGDYGLIYKRNGFPGEGILYINNDLYWESHLIGKDSLIGATESYRKYDTLSTYKCTVSGINTIYIAQELGKADLLPHQFKIMKKVE